LVIALLCNSGLNKSFLGETILRACYILNKTPNKISKLFHMNYERKENPTLNILRCGGVGLLSDYLNQKLGNWDEKPLNVFSWVMLNKVRIIGS
jgi:hypothetical protein